MVKNNILIAIRHLKRNKVFSLINMLGLSLSMVACLLIFKYVSFEKGYDSHIENAERVFRIYRIAEGEASDDGVASVFPPMAPVIKNSIPEVEYITRVIQSDKIFQSFAFSYYAPTGDIKTFNIPRAYFADDNALKIFTMNWEEGANTASLENPYEVVISSSYKERFFGKESAIGKLLRFKNMEQDFKVTGVFEDLAENTHFKYDVLVSFKSLPSEWDLDNNYGWGNFFTYLKLNNSGDPNLLEDKTNRAFVGIEGAWFKDEGVTFKLQNIQDIHLTSHHSFEMEVNGNKSTVGFLSIVGLFIMVIAWVNYVNLSTTKLIDRSKEVCIRKVLGGVKSQLIGQFLIEGLIINFLAMLLALTLLQFSSVFFRNLLGIPLDFFDSDSLNQTLVLLVLFTLGSLFFALYPAWLFSIQKVTVVLKGKTKTSSSGLALRKSLTVFQNVVALVLILGTMAVQSQLNFMQNQSLGMDIDQTLIVKKPFMDEANREFTKSAFVNDVKSMSGVQSIAASSEIPGYEISRMRFVALGPAEDDKALYAKDISVDESFISLYDIQVQYGRNFSNDFNDDQSVILSLSAAKDLLQGEELADWIGKTIYYETEPYTLVGIVDDISQESLKSNIEPHIYTHHDRVIYYSIKLGSEDIQNTMGQIEQAFDRNYSNSYFEYFFLDDYFNRQYKSDRLFGSIVSFFSILAIVITVLGLFGLSLYNINRRSKEVSVRKVLGASVRQLVILLIKEYAWLILLASFISIPIGYIFLNKWLANFANHINIGATLFLVPILIVFVLTLVTVGYQILKTVNTNPSDSLRYE
ncbi:ABC transporter permease [uncultured Roseivirga sp.]|uniref:ABC transporter permease n=1 Tax=uncultured Roseivirga sp. TaxID=543088 RepID=UPI0030DABAF4